MQFVSHFWQNCDVLKTVDRPLDGTKEGMGYLQIELKGFENSSRKNHNTES